MRQLVGIRGLQEPHHAHKSPQMVTREGDLTKILYTSHRFPKWKLWLKINFVWETKTFTIQGNFSVNRKNLQALTLVWPTRKNLVLDHLATQHLESWLIYMNGLNQWIKIYVQHRFESFKSVVFFGLFLSHFVHFRTMEYVTTYESLGLGMSWILKGLSESSSLIIIIGHNRKQRTKHKKGQGRGQVWKLSVSDVIVSQKGSKGDRKLHLFGQDYNFTYA